MIDDFMGRPVSALCNADSDEAKGLARGVGAYVVPNTAPSMSGAFGLAAGGRYSGSTGWATRAPRHLAQFHNLTVN